MNSIKVCAFTGHRPEKLPWGGNEQDPRCLALKSKIARAVGEAYDTGCAHFVCGMARGCDMYFFDAVSALKEAKGDVVVEAAVPFENQSAKWAEKDRQRWEAALKSCDRVWLGEKRYSPGCYAKRNRYMVDKAGLLISVYDGSGGGTGYTVAYAGSKGLPIVPIWL